MDKELTLKAVAHIHSDWSYDGAWSLSRIADFFTKIGCRLVLMSEHDATFDSERWQQYQEACRSFSTDKILLVPGMEYSDPSNTLHILIWGATSFLGKQQPTGIILKAANELEGFCVLAHPSRRQAWRQIDASWLPLLHGLEVWNRKADGFAPSKQALDLLCMNPHMEPFVGLDFHKPNQLFPLAMIITVKTSLSIETVFQALRHRNFTANALGIMTKHFDNKSLLSCMTALEHFRGIIARLLRRMRL